MRLKRNLLTHTDLIPVGSFAPDFAAAASDGTTVRLSALRGQKRVLLVFYPGDHTPVCTVQLCALRDHWAELQKRDTVVYGINPARVEKHAGFAARHRFPFPLIADRCGVIAEAYGCRALFGLVRRTVYMVDRDGTVAWVRRGNPDPEDILRVLPSFE